ncbi:MAG: cytochrome c3 family protein [Nitrospirota bacterium]
MKKKSKFALIILIILMMGLSSILSLSLGGETVEDIPKSFVPAPPPSENFPCSKCHDNLPVNRKQRKLEMYHTNIVLKHAEKDRWCLDCHERDKLRLPNGELIDYNKSYKLCGQCHGTIFRDWKAGIHGKRIGLWNGEKLYYFCVKCHDPHQPRFKALEPKKPPMNPAEIK